MLTKFEVFKKKLRNAAIWISKQDGSAGKRSRGLAAGVFSGCLPLFGLQTLVGIALAKIVNGNIFLAALGTWISNPFTYLPIYWFNYQVGSFLLGAKSQNYEITNWNNLLVQGGQITHRLLLGSTFVGTIAASIIFIVSYLQLQKLTKRK